MKQKLYSLFLTALLGMMGMTVWAQELTTTEIDGVTYYEIGSGDDLLAFAEMVNGDTGSGIASQPGVNGILTADIDLANVEWTPIGTSAVAFTGIFDGQGHAITAFEYEAVSDNNGLFGNINNAIVKNFRISGTLTSVGFTYNGVIGQAEGTSVISGIYSDMDITLADKGAHSGGIVGGMSTSSQMEIHNCEYAGTMTHTGAGDCQGGIVGYTYGGGVFNCIFSGTIIGEGSKYGGILGYCKVPGFKGVQNCLSVGKIIANEDNTTVAAIIANWNGGATENVKNNYYCLQEGSTTSIGIGNKASSCEAPVAVTAEQLASGEVTYLLNGKQTEDVAFYQTLPADQNVPDLLPTLDATHGIVYLNGRQHCDGTAYENAFYSNENTGITQDDHDIVDGFCSFCGLFDENFLTPNADGFYEITNASQLKWFAALVKAGHTDANAMLTNDIEFPESEDAVSNWTTPIGGGSGDGAPGASAYAGIFDGQGHSITGLNAEGDAHLGLFGDTNGATIKNFSISGTLNKTGGYGAGVVAWPANSIISNVHSSLVVDVPNSGTHHVGGVIGSARGGNIIDRCTFSGSVTVAVGSTDNFAGVVAYLGGDSVANCANYGSVTFNDAGCAGGGVAGYLNNTSTYIRNCLNFGPVVCTADSPKYGGAIVGRIKNNWSSARVINNYWLEGSAYGPSRKDDGSSPLTASEEGSSASDIASGEICWKLNNETFIDAIWHQVLGDEAYPVPYGDEGLVYETSNGGFECISDDPESLRDFINDIIAKETDFIEDENLVAYQVLIDEYKAAIDSWENIESLEGFLETYKASMEQKEAIKVSAANYALYIQACEATAAYIEDNNLQGETTDFLKTYLEDNVEPSEEQGGYPNGSYVYIIENLNLNDEAIAAEVLFVNSLLEAAVAADGIIPGNEITRLLTNPNFTGNEEDHFEGWTTEAGDENTTFATGGVPEVMNIARGKGNAFDIQQTVTDLPNGIYMMALNGMFRAGDYDGANASLLYAGQLYLNNTYNYFMSPSEDLISEGAAEDLVNCYLTDDEFIIADSGNEGYVPTTFKGCSYAYSAGRYQNFVATEVTDGTLIVGMRNLGSGLGDDWMPFGNLHLIYLGDADEASDALDQVLEGYKARAEVIVDFEEAYDVNDPNEYSKQPNISYELKAKLEQAIEDADNDPEDKIALINTFSELFNEVYACRKAYIAMLDAANTLSDCIGTFDAIEMISEEDFNYWDELTQDALNHFSDGDITTEEALALTEEMNNCQFMVKPVDGVYQLATTTDIMLFSVLVNNGRNNLKGVMVNDIDMSDITNFEPIGSEDNPFTGVFDGQGYAFTNFVFTAEHDFNGLFGLVKNATVKNFSISGTLTSDGHNYNGTIGCAQGSTVISGIFSSLDINTANFKAHTGGILGSTYGSGNASLVENCVYSGTMTHSGTGDCVGGILGYTYNGGVKNCLFSGTIIGEGVKYGGILAYCKVPGFLGVQNCLSVGKIVANESNSTAAAIIANWNGGATSNVKNNYYMFAEGSNTGIAIGNNASSCEAPHAVNSLQLANGEVCYKLNGDQSVINWTETINEDDYPLPYTGHEQVFFDEEGSFYYNLINGIPVGINEVKSEEPKVETVMTGIFNLAGQRLEKLQKGINIVNGKKVLVK